MVGAETMSCGTQLWHTGAQLAPYPPHWIHRGRGGAGFAAGTAGQAVASLIRDEKVFLWKRLLIDNEGEEGVVCQNGTLEGALGDPAGPPFPLRLPTIVLP